MALLYVRQMLCFCFGSCMLYVYIIRICACIYFRSPGAGGMCCIRCCCCWEDVLIRKSRSSRRVSNSVAFTAGCCCCWEDVQCCLPGIHDPSIQGFHGRRHATSAAFVGCPTCCRRHCAASGVQRQCGIHVSVTRAQTRHRCLLTGSRALYMYCRVPSWFAQNAHEIMK